MPSTTSVVLAASLALASTVAAAEVPQRPRIYFPQRVKREITGGAPARANVHVPVGHAVAASEPEEKRGMLGDLLGGVLGDKKKGGVTTVVVSRTMVVSPPPKGTGNHPGETVKPTTSSKTPKPSKSSKKPKPTTTSGILVGPTGIIFPESSTSTPESSTKTGGGILDPIQTLITELLPGAPKTSSTESESAANVTSTPEEATKSASETPSTTSKGGLGPILTSLLPLPGSSTSEPVVNGTSTEPATEAPTTTSKGGLGPILTSLLPIPGTTSTSEPVANGTETELPTGTPTTPQGGLGPILTSLLPIPGTTTTSEPIANGTSTETPTGLPTGTGPDTTSIPIGTPTSSTELPGGNVTSTETPVPGTTTTELPISNNTTTTVEPITTPSTTSVIETPTAANTTIPVSTESTTSEQLPPTTISSVPTTTKVPETTTQQGVTSIKPTATATNTENWLPTTIVVEPTTFSYSAPTSVQTATSSKALPSNIPKVILPDGGSKPAPPGTTEIHIGFLFPLNYDFVASNTVAAAQIFNYLPDALASAGGISADKIQFVKLVPWDTRDKYGYITTIAKLNYPENIVEKLRMSMWSANSRLYHNELNIVNNLTAVINTKIPLTGDYEGDGTDGGAGGNPGSNNNNKGGNDAFGSSDKGEQTGKQKATTAGIAIGALGFSVMYGAAMFIVARRYKRKRQTHRRSSSISGSQASSEMQYTGSGSPALMGGALMSNNQYAYGSVGRESPNSIPSEDRGARNANISAPVATENSLGWN